MTTNNDRDLLEKAAKAAGYKWDWYGCSFHISIDEKRYTYWNPLTDDGDALRLAVKLDLAVMPYPVFESPKHSVVVSQRNLEHSRFEVVELYETDPYAATRRAIVRAAVMIGESM